MKIKQIEIKDLEVLQADDCIFSDMNVLYTEKERTRMRNPGFYREYAVWKDGCSLSGVLCLRVAAQLPADTRSSQRRTLQ